MKEKIATFFCGLKQRVSALGVKGFLLRFFAVLGVLATVSFSLGAYAGWRYFHPRPREVKVPEAMVLTLDFTQPIDEAARGFSFSLPSLLEETHGQPLLYIVRALENAKDDSRVKGVIARFAPYESPDLAQTQEIAAALDRFRAAGKPAYAYAASYGDFTEGRSLYALASHFDHIWLQPIGAVALSPLVIEAPFGKTALARFGIEADFLRREDYKSVMENVTHDHFSAPVRANMESLVADLNAQVVHLLAQGRKIEGDKARTLLNSGPFTAQEALASGLVTKIAYEDEFLKEVDDKLGKESASVDPLYYLYLHSQDNKTEPKGTIALIYADGMIADAPPMGPYNPAGDEIVDTEALVGAFEDAAEDQDVKAILFRVNSPGGSPTASESLRRALVKAKESKKPVYVSMGAMAASGGYWISMDADRIFADGATLTGSIGVVAGKFVIGGLLDKMGVKVDTIGAENRGAMHSMRAPFDTKNRARMNAMLDETYGAFTAHVAAARKIPPEKMPEVAKGRVFTGQQALALGLVDELGGMDAAITGLKKALSMQPTDRLYLQQFPAPETPQTLLFRILKSLRFGGAMALDTALTLRRAAEALRPLTAVLSRPQNAVSAWTPPLSFQGRSVP